eukprot:TRINITY_DN32009_c0_g1_i1.p1 TRINITY_DN32009_c0_g1~~TRINITY_DN32009_c0_g1_i1.p1  ORF type:complete len:657 (+),score=94.01 TRINITY_DN32009_c0_g1_i1:71-1972(+)
MPACLKGFMSSSPSSSVLSPSSWKIVRQSGPGPLRCIVRRHCGDLLGLWLQGTELQTWTSGDSGKSWTQLGSVANSPSIDGDPNLLVVPHFMQIFCAFRLHAPDGSWQVVVCRSDDDGSNWIFDSTVAGPVRNHFVGAPFLFLTSEDNLQVYFDNEEEPAKHGHSGTQWITMKQRQGTRGSWDTHGLVVVGAPSGFVRDGMATVVQLDAPERIMVVMEGIVPGANANTIHAAESFDFGRTWGLRTEVYCATKDRHGAPFNSYNPWAMKPVSPGPVYVAFCTDEDFAGPPDPADMSVDKRRSHTKIVRTMSTFEDWSASASTIYAGNDHMYEVGLFALNARTILSTVLVFGLGIVISTSGAETAKLAEAEETLGSLKLCRSSLSSSSSSSSFSSSLSSSLSLPWTVDASQGRNITNMELWNSRGGVCCCRAERDDEDIVPQIVTNMAASISTAETGVGEAASAGMVTYEGQWRDKQFHGRGRLLSPDGSVYDGQFRLGSEDGYGRFVAASGSVHEGDWKDGRKHGFGTLSNDDGSLYSGRWDMGNRCGHGFERFADSSTFEGQFDLDLKHGNGVYTSSSGRVIFEGQFRFNCMHGDGRYYFSDGRKYTGGWLQGYMHGDGVMVWPDGVNRNFSK